MFEHSIYQNRSLYEELTKCFRPNFNVKKHLEIAEEYFNQKENKSYNVLARKHECSPTRIKKIIKAYKEKILPVIKKLQNKPDLNTSGFLSGKKEDK